MHISRVSIFFYQHVSFRRSGSKASMSLTSAKAPCEAARWIGDNVMIIGQKKSHNDDEPPVLCVVGRQVFVRARDNNLENKPCSHHVVL